jgi:DNA-binding transcriptional ArsR family regulator
VRVVDLRSGATPPRLEVRASPAAELLRLLGVLVTRDEVGDYDVGEDRIRQVTSALPPGVFDRAREIGRDRALLTLSIAAARLEPPGTVDDLLHLLDDDPTLPWRLLLSTSCRDWDWEPVAADARALASGDPDAVERLRAAADDPARGVPARVRALLELDATAYGRQVAEVVRATRDSVWSRLADEAMDAIERDVAHRRSRIDVGDAVGTLVLEATNGYELPEDPSVRRVLLLPSFWMRPWIVVDQLDDTLVLSTPVADSFVALPAEVPPPPLLKLTKALADEGRLQLLRRMSTGRISLAEATDHLGVTKPTAHHHLSILRQAGLVTMSGGGRSTRYALRRHPAEVAHEALATYVPALVTDHPADGAR